MHTALSTSNPVRLPSAIACVAAGVLLCVLAGCGGGIDPEPEPTADGQGGSQTPNTTASNLSQGGGASDETLDEAGDTSTGVPASLTGEWTGTATESRAGQTISGAVCLTLVQFGSALSGTYLTWSDQTSMGSSGSIVGSVRDGVGTVTLTRDVVPTGDSCPRADWSFSVNATGFTGDFATEAGCNVPATGTISLRQGPCTIGGE